MEINLGEVDGVRVLSGWTEGPIRAGLVFDVGRRDEYLAINGITHLVEHLALSGLGQQPYNFNGQVTPTHTRFLVEGDESDVRSFLETVCRALRDPPVGRLSDELRILQIEESRRNASPIGIDLAYRFGASGPGLIGWPEYGFFHLSHQHVLDWSHKWFTAANAALWISGPVPQGLRLPLEVGAPMHHTPNNRDRTSGRVWVGSRTNTVSLSLVHDADDSYAGNFAAILVRDRAYESLRSEQAISYSVDAVQIALSSERILCHFVADGDAKHYDKVLAGLVESAERVAQNGPTEAEISALTQRWRLSLASGDGRSGLLDMNTTRLLARKPLLGKEDIEDQVAAVTAARIAAAIADGLQGALAIGPDSLGTVLPGWHQAESWSTTSIEGQRFEAIPPYESGYLVLGPDGLAWHKHQRSWRCVRWSDCVLCLTWDNGVRRCVGSDGVSVVVLPWAWQGGERISTSVDELVAADVCIKRDLESAPRQAPVLPKELPEQSGARAPSRSGTEPSQRHRRSDFWRQLRASPFTLPVVVLIVGIGALVAVAILTDARDLEFWLPIAVLAPAVRVAFSWARRRR